MIQATRRLVRGLLGRKGYAAVVTATLAVGVGASTTMFGLVDAVLLEPPPFHEPDRLVLVRESDPRRPLRNPSPADFLDIRARVGAFSGVSAFLVRSGTLTGTDEPEQVVWADVSADFFQTLGVRAAVGRVFGPEPVEEGARVAVLGHGLWQRRFGGDPSVVGRTVLLDGTAWLVVGVMPPAFQFPEGATLWTAAPRDIPGSATLPGDPTLMRDAWFHEVVARLAPGATHTGAAAELEALAAVLAADHPETNAGATIWTTPLREDLVADVRGTLLLLLGATGLVLLIVCANVANLILVRAVGRGGEWAVRRALGAARRAVVAQVLAEGALLGGVGAALGAALAWGANRVLAPVVGPLLPSGVSLGMDVRVLGWAMGIGVGTALLAGAFPAWRAAGQAPADALRRGGTRSAGSRSESRVREALVGAEVALAVVLVLVTGLLLRSLSALHAVDLGFDPDPVTAAVVGMPRFAAADVEAREAAFGRVTGAVAAIPGVEGVAWVQGSPLSVGAGAGLRIRGVNETDPDLVDTRWQAVSHGYFEVLGIPVRSGRTFTEADREGGDPVAVVNEAFVRRFFPGQDPVGRLVNTGLDGRDGEGWRWVRILGVVGDTRNRGPAGMVEPVLFRPMAQPAPGYRGGSTLLVVRASSAGTGLDADLRRAVRSAAPDAPLGAARRGRALVAGYVAGDRMLSGLLGAFATLALVLGALGVYGTARYGVERRTRELGVRLALGADGGRLSAMVVGQGLRPAFAGLGAGLAISFVVVRLLRSRLFEVGPMDPMTWTAVPLLLVAVAVAATWLPARRASRTDPVAALREE